MASYYQTRTAVPRYAYNMRSPSFLGPDPRGNESYTPSTFEYRNYNGQPVYCEVRPVGQEYNVREARPSWAEHEPAYHSSSNRSSSNGSSRPHTRSHRTKSRPRDEKKNSKFFSKAKSTPRKPFFASAFPKAESSYSTFERKPAYEHCPKPTSAPTRPTELYDVLGVPVGASHDDIKAAHRKLALKSHPDRIRGDEAAKLQATKRMAEINRAMNILGDDDRREKYDRTGKY
ncbi:DnaJ-domain-containing protein [Polyplosphaeria fusca]|uniref:DnaJ-domain-containing protein n=1 Tax=Polyplosphaeria fusca TaxID=682080 RepID=A0A9P4RCP6_9PLEO|nr:DnaJ-domain-containing protein [Polyplosphaeria fusca]